MSSRRVSHTTNACFKNSYRVITVQDYAEDYVNSILAPLRTPEALAEAMLVLGRNETLRRQIGHTARELVLRHNSVEVVFKHNAKIFRFVDVPARACHAS